MDIWLKAYTIYQKDPKILEEFVKYLEHDRERALREARSYTKALTDPPKAVTLGFSPQPLLAVLALNPGEKIFVITSPEVANAVTPPAHYSHKVLNIYRDRVVLFTTLMAPTLEQPPNAVLSSLIEAFCSIKEKATPLDISGGTQLAAIAAVKAGVRQLTYSYPQLNKLVIYPLTY